MFFLIVLQLTTLDTVLAELYKKPYMEDSIPWNPGLIFNHGIVPKRHGILKKTRP